MTSINVPEPVMSLAIQPRTREGSANFSKAINRCVLAVEPYLGALRRGSGLRLCDRSVHCPLLEGPPSDMSPAIGQGIRALLCGMLASS